ncbi:metallophosphatase [Bombilactobacillus folatiphilus]|uniref:Metallophosphatase n=1 Tax=Bombilactobacillus folatiphilus TaxID=2923362 RepID=A0ABY4PAC9_9LACO|nr:metallophosphatase [Bombilactobacillus folatiphilus]UQS82486.1 metallophosphatase [Bombilactobacillus folatiphilus]
MDEQIQLLHTNDLHSHFENFPRIERFIKHRRQVNQEANVQTFLFDVGDATDRQHPLTETTQAQANIQWMNRLNYDAVTIGNSEGLYYSHNVLEHMYDTAKFDVIVGNLKETNQMLPHFAKEYRIITTAKQTKIGLLGLTAPYTSAYPLADWRIEEVAQVLPTLIVELAPQVDVLVLLSHLGLSMDRILAKTYPQLDIIIGAHTHHLLPQGELVNQTLLTAAGKYGQHVGMINLQLQDHQLITKSARTIQTATLPEHAADQRVITTYEREGRQLLQQQKLAWLPTTLTKNPFTSCAAINMALQALKEITHSSAAMLSSGLFLTDLQAGLVTADTLHQQLPHAVHIMITKLKGQDFWRFVMEVEKNRGFLRNFPQKGMGFRGKIFGEIVFSGVQVDHKLQQVFYNGQLVQSDRIYQIALLDHYSFIPFFPTLQIVGQNRILYPEFFRETLGRYLTKKYPLKQESD